MGRVDFGEHVVFTPFPKRPAGLLALLLAWGLRWWQATS